MMEIKYTTIPLTQETFQLAMEIGANALQARLYADHRKFFVHGCYLILFICLLNIFVFLNFVISSVTLLLSMVCYAAVKYTIYKENQYMKKAMECKNKIDKMLNHETILD